HHRRIIGEECIPLPVRDGSHDALGPWMTCGREKNLQEADLFACKITDGSDDSGEWIGVKFLENAQRAHELFRQAKVHDCCGSISQRPKISLALHKNHFREVGLKLFPYLPTIRMSTHDLHENRIARTNDLKTHGTRNVTEA